MNFQRAFIAKNIGKFVQAFGFSCGTLAASIAHAQDPCSPKDPNKRGLSGAFIRQTVGTPKLELLQISGAKRRNGRVRKIVVDDYTFTARKDRKSEVEGALKAFRGARAVPIAALDGIATDVFSYNLNYKKIGTPGFEGLAILGVPTKPSTIPGNGAATLKGTVVVHLSNLADGADPQKMEFTGQAEIRAKFGSKIVDVSITGLSKDAPFQSIEWRRAAICGDRIASAGTGGFQLLDAEKKPVLFAGASGDSPAGTAIIDGRFFGADEGGKPTSIGGGFLIQGDLGLVSGLFLTIPGG